MAKKYNGNIDTTESRKWLITINNPNDNLKDFPFTPWTSDAEQDLANWKFWIEEKIKPAYYAISFEYGLEENHTPHIHIYLTRGSAWTGSTLRNKFQGVAHLDVRDKTHLANRNYVFKESLSEKNADKIAERIEGRQAEGGTMPAEKYNVGGGGTKIKKGENPLVVAKRLIEEGKRPNEILDANPLFYRYKSDIKEMYFDKRKRETPIKRDIEVIVDTGIAGSGKSHVMTTFEDDEVFIATDYSTGLFDGYEGQENLFMDEFRGQIPYNQLLTVLDGYKVPVHARYNNVLSLWDTVHITSVIPIEDWYNNENIRDTFEQLKRRISKITYHYIIHNGILITNIDRFLAKYSKSEIQYHEYTIDAAKYTSYEELEKEALAAGGVIARYNDDMSITVNLDLKRPKWLVKRDSERHVYWNKKKDIMNNDPFGLMIDEYKELIPFELTPENDIFHMLKAQ